MKSSVWQKIQKGASSAIATALFAIISYAEVYALVSTGFFEMNKESSFGLSLATMAVLAILILATLYFAVTFYRALYRRDTKRNGKVAFFAEIGILILGFGTVLLAMFGGATDFATYEKTLPYFVGFLGVAVFLYLIPLAKKKAYFAIVAVCAGAIIIGAASAISLDREEFGFEENPAVFDTGTDFSVVWCTNDVSISYLEYTYDGQKYTVYDAESGRYRADRRVHTVHVPYEHLFGNTYTVSAAKVIRNTPYTSKIGDYITSDAISFKAKPGEEKLTVISASDWHEDTAGLYKAVSACEDFDLLLMMGDPANSLDEFEDILRNVVIPGGKITGGTKPILYVRGNHEPRGRYADYLGEVLGYDKFYYTTSYGEQNFLVFDGGEDKSDGNEEYGGLIVSEPYRKAELEEMNALPVLEGNNICLCHIPRYTIASDAEGKALFESILEKQNVKLEISGHEHKLSYREKEKYGILIDGGPINDGEQFVLCYIEMENGKANIKAVSESGKTLETYGPIALK